MADSLVEPSGRGRAGGGGGGPSLGTLVTVGGVGARSTPADINQPIRVCHRPAGQEGLLHCRVLGEATETTGSAQWQTQAWWEGPSGRQSTTQQTFLTSRGQSGGRRQRLKTNQKDFFVFFFLFLFRASTSCQTSCQTCSYTSCQTPQTLAYLRHTWSLAGWHPLLVKDRTHPVREQGGDGWRREGGVA